MCNTICGIVTSVIGVILVIVSCIIGFVVVPNLIDNIIINQVVLLEDTVQMERFEEVPFPLQFSATLWQVTNIDAVLNGGAPELTERGPYVYKLYQYRNVTSIEDDLIRYRRVDHFEFDAEASYPYTEDDMVTIVNVPYHAIIQIAESRFPALMPILNSALPAVFGIYNGPFLTTRAGDLFLDGIRICDNPGLVGIVACNIISLIGADAQNLVEQPDGSILFSLFSYKDRKPTAEYEVYRGLDDPKLLADIIRFDDLPYFQYWVNEAENVPSICNSIRGTDSGIFAPFLDRDASIYAMNLDICRSVELRYQYDIEVDGIPTVRYAANDWFLDNHEGCYCLNVTNGVNREDGCLLTGTMELYSCVGAMLVLSYPHFLYADSRYRNSVFGMNPNVENHRIFLDIEPLTGTPVRGAKRAQFNIFLKPITSVPATTNLRTVLTPVVWIEEGIDIPEEYKNEIKDRLLFPLRLVDILIPVIIAVCGLVLVIGIVLLVVARRRKPINLVPTTARLEESDDNKKY